VYPPDGSLARGAHTKATDGKGHIDDFWNIGGTNAGALFARRNPRARLVADHANAKRLSSGLASLKGLEASPGEVETNMVRFGVRVMPAEQLVERLRARGVLMLAVGPDTIRAVTSLMVSPEDIEEAVRIISEVLK
jgi:threonine aldolase